MFVPIYFPVCRTFYDPNNSCFIFVVSTRETISIYFCVKEYLISSCVTHGIVGDGDSRIDEYSAHFSRSQRTSDGTGKRDATELAI
jgi:hypothetical protein